MGNIQKRHEATGTKTGHHANQYLAAGDSAQNHQEANNRQNRIFSPA